MVLGLPAIMIGCGGTNANDGPGPDTYTPTSLIADPHGIGLALPPAGNLYHGVFPGDDPSAGDAEEDGVSPATVRSYETAVGKTVAWVYFSHNWYAGREFPVATASWIRDLGSVPFIRLMLRSSDEQNIAEPLFTPDAISSGEFDADLKAWGQAAAAFGTPLLVEYGTEVNGNWFSWNGEWNGGAEEGPEAFRRAFRRIVRVISAEGASNITWVFHVNAQDVPNDAWNRFEEYYPGDDAVDWVGVSVYGVQDPQDDEWVEFSDAMDTAHARLVAMAPGKPIAVLEMGVSGGNPLGDPAEWAKSALSSLEEGRWPNVVGFAWWNEAWQNDSDPVHDTDMRVETVPGLAAAIAAKVASSNVLGAPIVGP